MKPRTSIRMKTGIFLALLLIPFIGLSQNGNIIGRVFDLSNNQKLPFANVVVSGTSTRTTTDENGLFQISGLEPGFIRVEVSVV